MGKYPSQWRQPKGTQEQWRQRLRQQQQIDATRLAITTKETRQRWPRMDDRRQPEKQTREVDSSVDKVRVVPTKEQDGRHAVIAGVHDRETNARRTNSHTKESGSTNATTAPTDVGDL
jgi:hypothetical protein